MMMMMISNYGKSLADAIAYDQNYENTPTFDEDAIKFEREGRDDFEYSKNKKPYRKFDYWKNPIVNAISIIYGWFAYIHRCNNLRYIFGDFCLEFSYFSNNKDLEDAPVIAAQRIKRIKISLAREGYK